jgi:4-amino-4-deoxy-L-arabinose transferase-like glycosyltransferase
MFLKMAQDHWPLAVIMAVAGVFRFPDLGRVGFNNDEAVYAGQAAALAGNSVKAHFFSIFRAHPLLIQFLISLPYRFQVSEIAGRAVIATLATLTVASVYPLGVLMFSRKTAILGSLMLALLPYHLLVSRQVLLDVGLGFFYALTMVFLVKYVNTSRLVWAYAFGASSALAILSKETGLLLIPVILIFLRLRNMLKIKPFIVVTCSFLLALAPGPLSLFFGGGTGRSTLMNVIVWQVSRPANHTWLFYPTVLFQYFDVVAIIGILGLVVALKRRTSSDLLLLLWFGLPYLFFQIWPVKGFHYIAPIAPAVCLLAGRFFEFPMPRITTMRVHPARALKLERVFSVFLAFLAVGSLVVTYASATAAIQQVASPTAGFSGFYGGRELGTWIKENVPEKAVFLTVGVTMANLIMFYGDRDAFALSVSPNPLNRNPAYSPIRNPDYEIQTGKVQYLVWDVYSGTRSQHFSDRLMGLVGKYNGQLVVTISVEAANPHGGPVQTDIVKVYRVYGTAGK